jgi:hypothetical protein
MKKYIWVVLAAIIITGCASPRKLVLTGQYDAAIAVLVKKLSRNATKDENILLLERAYLGGQQQDLERINYLKKENQADNWVEITDHYNSIKRRQALIKPLMPLHLAKANRQSNIQFINIDDQLISSKTKAAEYYYQSGVTSLKQGGRGNARKAFIDFLEAKTYNNSGLKNLDSLLKLAKKNGITHVLFRMKNATQTIIPADFENELLKISLQELNSEWVSYDVRERAEVKYSYVIVANLKEIIVSPQKYMEREYEETKKIQDGFEYELDSKGNVKKDSLGNDIKHPKYKTIKCLVKEVQQTKSGSINAIVDYLNTETNQLLGSYAASGNSLFENFAAKALGDTNALTEETKKKLGNQPLPFPTDLNIINLAGQTLKPQIKNIIWDKKYLIN